MAEHKNPNYMAIFWWLFGLTLAELGVYALPLVKWLFVILLISLALSKAALVAMFFMHLRIEHRTLSLIAVTPLVLGALLVFLLSMDISFVPLHTADAVRTTAAGH
ncbi:MAG TPA: cytochrome C oxidase subunit IV family protein [bacterium]|nr:cytochrome C oxidase subunit IV family protein [bacterium]